MTCPVDHALREPLKWPMTSLIRQAVLEGMTSRADLELGEVAQGVGIEEVHGEAVQTYGEYERLVRGASLVLKILGLPIKGCAADLGSGTGVGACILSKLTRVNSVHAIDYSETFVRNVMPVVFKHFKGVTEKIQRVVGDFNALQFEEGSLDVILEIGALHHSEELSLTLENCYRVLRPEGVMIAIDRAWPDHYTDEQLNAMLNKQLPDHLKRKYGIPLTSSFTRRDWGEHEYRVSQYLKAFADQGFDAAAMIQAYPAIRGINRVLRRSPIFHLSLILAALLHQRGRRRLWIYGFSSQRVVFIALKQKISQ